MYREDGSIDLDLTSDFLSNIPCLPSEEENVELMNPFQRKRSLMLYGLWSQIKPHALTVFPFIFIEFVGQ